MFGVGILELMVIMLLAVIVVGPDRLPAVAADLARWIRQGRAYARVMMKDFNEVVGELQKEAGTNTEDLKEIGSLFTRHAGDIGTEIAKVTRDLEDTGDLAAAKAQEPSNVVPIDGARDGAAEPVAQSTDGAAEAAPAEEKPWYVPEKPRASRRRSSE